MFYFIQNFSIKILSFLKKQIEKEYSNIRFWLIIIFAFGILTSFFSSSTIRIITIILCFFIISLCSIIYALNNKKNHKIHCFVNNFFITTAVFLFGMIISSFKIYTTPNITETFNASNAVFDAYINEIRLTSNDTYLTITAINPPITSIKNKKIKVKFSGNAKELAVGDKINITTSLANIKYNIYPQDKSYENYAKFFGIVARGKVKNLKILEHEQKFFDIDVIRRNIQNRIYDVNNGSVGSAIVIDILTGNNSFIPRDKLANIRHSGCAHILAISGLHMSVIVSFVFLLILHILALFPKISYYYDIKKIATIPAILTCFLYLNMANIPISALRSFTMVGLGCVAIWLNRPKTTINILFLTFFSILITSPHQILSPSFQMSFMAVFCLISVYNNDFLTNSTKNIFHNKIIRYSISILSSSIIATIATIFFEIYHFKQYAWIGLLSNIFVIPLTEFIVLPIGFIGMLLNGTIIGDLFYKISAFFADIISYITDYTAEINNSFLLVPQMQLWQLAVIISGIICLFLCKSYLFKIIGVLLSIIGILFYVFQPKTILLYQENLNNIVFLENNKYYSYTPIKNEYLMNVWAQNLGVKKIYQATKDNKNISCNFENEIKNKDNIKKIKKQCFYVYNNKRISIIQKNSSKSVAVKNKNNVFLIVK